MSIKKITLATCSSLFLIIIVAFYSPKNTNNYHKDNCLSYKIETKIEDYIKNDDYQGAVLIAKDGKILFNKAYGFADRENTIENTSKTQFLIGSLTKSFVAVSVLQLAEEGLLDLNAPIKRHIPELKDKLAKELTLHLLLKHQSGLVPHLERITEFEDKDISPKEIIEIINTSS
ncbi:serine hydrolase [uncultured Aquimarina sp.]|uniref:serine hydrolase domain-containing protein n=1 Tax=uncultured Aquimarina sp. TaxID=575652 RepID=UPI00260BF84B|nr:serine hydrolase domain-containing protein [uncultured Aquimarina sp.]